MKFSLIRRSCGSPRASMAALTLMLAAAAFQPPLQPAPRTSCAVAAVARLFNQRAPSALLAASPDSKTDGRAHGMGTYSTEVGAWPEDPQLQKPRGAEPLDRHRNGGRGKGRPGARYGGGRGSDRGSRTASREVHRQKMDRQSARLQADPAQTYRYGSGWFIGLCSAAPSHAVRRERETAAASSTPLCG